MTDHKIRFKRIIDGKTYNTETSIKLAVKSSFDDPEKMTYPESGEILFQTRHGAYFLYEFDDGGPEPWRLGHQRIMPLEPEQAQRWTEQNCPDAVEAIFGEMPDAGEAEAKVTLRMPEALRRRLVALAETEKRSMNALIVRCLEGCVQVQDKHQ